MKGFYVCVKGGGLDWEMAKGERERSDGVVQHMDNVLQFDVHYLMLSFPLFITRPHLFPFLLTSLFLLSSTTLVEVGIEPSTLKKEQHDYSHLDNQCFLHCFHCNLHNSILLIINLYKYKLINNMIGKYHVLLITLGVVLSIFYFSLENLRHADVINNK